MLATILGSLVKQTKFCLTGFSSQIVLWYQFGEFFGHVPEALRSKHVDPNQAQAMGVYAC